jgi:hypothetical protein
MEYSILPGNSEGLVRLVPDIPEGTKGTKGSSGQKGQKDKARQRYDMNEQQ